MAKKYMNLEVIERALRECRNTIDRLDADLVPPSVALALASLSETKKYIRFVRKAHIKIKEAYEEGKIFGFDQGVELEKYLNGQLT